MANDKIIWDFLKEKIGNEYGVAGLMGNLYAESGLIPTNMENAYEKKLGYTDSTYTAAVDNGEYTKFGTDAVGYGLAQWTYHTRKKGLLAYAQSKKVSIGDLNMQLEYLYKELSESYKGVLSTLKSANSIKMASNKVLTDFERPANQSESVKSLRAKYGQNYYDKYANTTTANSTIEEEESTVGYTVEALLNIARNEIGYHEKASNSNLDSKTANSGSNNYTKYARDLNNAGYYNGNKNGYAWCDVFVDWCFLQLCNGNAKKAQEIICQTGELGAAVNYSANYYKNQNRYYTSNPQPGDQIFFKSGSSMVHTGIVESVTSSYVNTIEGNSSDQVIRRSYNRSSTNIAGYGRPKYDDTGNLSSADGATSSIVTGNVTSDGTPTTSNNTARRSYLGSIKGFQQWINDIFNYGISVDGKYGPETKKAAIKALQKSINTLYGYNLEVDGIAGLKTKNAIKSKINLKKGSSGSLVYILQGLLYCKGYDPNGLDGVFGAGTDSALRKFQAASNITIDGEAGQATFNKLFL